MVKYDRVYGQIKAAVQKHYENEKSPNYDKNFSSNVIEVSGEVSARGGLTGLMKKNKSHDGTK